MTMHKALHLRDDTDRLYVPRKGEKRVANIEDWVDASIWRLYNYIKKNKLTAVTA